MDRTHFYVAACGTGDDAGIYTIDIEDGRYRKLAFLAYRGASYLCYSPDGKFVYLANEDAELGGVASFAIEGETLRLVNQIVSPGNRCCHVTVSNDGRYLYAANYGKGQLQEYELNSETGEIIGMTKLVQHVGKGINPARQEKAHVHSCYFTPDNKYLISIDLGLDAIDAYPWQAGKGIDEAGVRRSSIEPAGSGPRHLVWSKANGDIAYLLNELLSTITVLHYSDGCFTQLQTVDMLPPTLRMYSKASAIRLSPDGRFLYGSNRGYDTIAGYRIGDDGLLSPFGLWFCGGKGPRDFNFIPGGKLFCGCENSNDAYIFDFDETTGALWPDGNVIPLMPRPICII